MSESLKLDLIALRDSILGNAYLGQDHEIELIDKIRAAEDTALAEAEARGYARGLEAAAKVADQNAAANLIIHGVGSALARECRRLANVIHSLATTPAETQKPEETA